MVNKEDIEMQLYSIITNEIGIKFSIETDSQKELFYYNSKMTPAVALYLISVLSKKYKVSLEKIRAFFANNTFCYKNIVECIYVYCDIKN